MQEAVRTFFVTLRRSPIGVPWFHKRVLRSLGLVRRHDCIERPNNATVRGQLEKVAHLVRIETDSMFYARKLNEAAAAEVRPPIIVRHGAGSGSSSSGSSSSSSGGGPPGLGQL